MLLNSSFVNNVLEKMAVMQGISTRRMFDGIGIYRFGQIFALIVDERLYFKVSSVNKPDFQQAGSVPFIYNRHDKNGGDKLVTMSYWEVPPYVLESEGLMFIWMTKAYEAAVKARHKEAV
jgi:DNA transformation protein